MPRYRRAYLCGGTYFFTVNLRNRTNADLLIRHIDCLRDAVRAVRLRYPFDIHGWVVLPDHIHCVIQLPNDDHDFSLRWRLIKTRFTKALPVRVRPANGPAGRGVWQHRFWEHLIRDERDFAAHMDYVHVNPVKHGLVERVVDWPYSTFHRLVEKRVYDVDWAGSVYADELEYGD